jgi:hypothetical protein
MHIIRMPPTVVPAGETYMLRSPVPRLQHEAEHNTTMREHNKMQKHQARILGLDASLLLCISSSESSDSMASIYSHANLVSKLLKQMAKAWKAESG